MSRYQFRPWMALAAVLLLLVVAFFGTFFIYGGTNGFVNPVENIAGSAAAPAVSGLNGFTASIKDFFNRLFALRDVDKKYNDLKMRNQMLEVENQFMQDLQQENETLYTMLGAKEQQYPDFKCKPAKVIGKDTGSNWFMNFTLNRGNADGIKVDMPVVNEKGLVGRVVEVGHNWCKVMAIIDPQSAVSAVIESSRDFGMVCGTGDPHGSEPVCDINYLTMNANVVPGDKVITSDLGGVFYSGITIGTVGSVGKDENNNIKAELIPAVDFSHIEDVLILTSDQSIPTDADIKAEESQQANATTTPDANASPSPKTQPTDSPDGQPANSPSASPTNTPEAAQ